LLCWPLLLDLVLKTSNGSLNLISQRSLLHVVLFELLHDSLLESALQLGLLGYKLSDPLLNLRHLGVQLVDLQLPLLFVISEDGYVLLLVEWLDLVLELNNFAFEGVEADEGLQLVLVDLALDLSYQAIQVLAQCLNFLWQSFNPAVDLIMHLLFHLHDLLRCGIRS